MPDKTTVASSPAKPITIRTGYGPHERVQYRSDLPSLAKQSFAGECDINNIMSRFTKTGMLEHVRQNPGQYQDLPEDTDYHNAINLVIDANNAFLDLPSKIRGRFNNDPEKFLSFVADPENHDELVTLGLAEGSSEADPAGSGTPDKEEGGQPPLAAKKEASGMPEADESTEST